MERDDLVALCRGLDREWLQGIAATDGGLILFVSPGAGPGVEEMLAELHVGYPVERVRKFEGRFRALVDLALARGPVCNMGVPNIRPGGKITPVGGRTGILSCFAKDAQGMIYGLTVEHLFAQRSGDVCNQAGNAGSFVKDGGLAAGEAPADCAVFSVHRDANLESNLATHHVVPADLPDAVGKRAHRASDFRLSATVTSVTACVKYEIDVVDGEGDVVAQSVKVTDQILLFDDSGTFAGEGDSGSLALMSEPAGSSRTFAPVGLCTAYFSGRKIFVASPLAACLHELGVTYLPRL